MNLSVKTAVAAVTIALLSSLNVLGQAPAEQKVFPYSNRLSIVAGLIQPLVLNGGNFEVTYYSKKMSFDYSHGFSLEMQGNSIFGEGKTQHLAYHLPYSTGFGVGYRLTSFFDLRVEPKMHSWEVYYEGEQQNSSTLIKSYKTFTLGIGAYYRYMPFKNSKSKGLQGITTSTSVRFWPNVGSTLTDNKFTYQNKLTGKKETLKAANIGNAGSPMIFNLSIGYTFGGK